jgi:chromatin modification-related protein VID21
MMYPYNWQLVTDSFNSEMVTIPTEKRLPYDCFERWDLTFGPDAEKKREAAAAQAAAAAAKAQEAGANTSAAPTAPPSGNATPATGNPSSVPPATPMTANQPGQPPAIAVPTLPNQTNAEGGPSEAPPPPGLSKREAKAAARNKYEGTKKAIRHQALYDSVRRLIRRRETTKQKTNSEWNNAHWILQKRS